MVVHKLVGTLMHGFDDEVNRRTSDNAMLKFRIPIERRG
jgi:hypothetical protein